MEANVYFCITRKPEAHMITEKMQQMLNEQFHREMLAANQYLAISSYFEGRDLDGFSHFFRLQAQEEMSHAMKQFDYLHRVDGRIIMQQVPQPQTEFGSDMEALEFALNHERKVTKDINRIMKVASEEEDFATQTFMQWFVNEQVEEEDLLRTINKKLAMVGDNTSALYLLNEELRQRKPEPGVTDGI